MARIRTIKPDFFTSSDIVSLSPLARLFFIALWCEADRCGRLIWNEKTLKLRYLPGDDCDVSKLAQELIDADLILVYEVERKKYAEIPTFVHHQVINNRESESVLPPPCDASGTRQARVKAEGKGKEGKGKEYASRKTRIPADFSLTDDLVAYAARLGVSDTRTLENFTDEFINSCKAKDYKYSDFGAAWKTWLRKKIEEGKMPKASTVRAFPGV